MSVYLDASVLVPLLLPEPGSAATDAFVRAHRGELVVAEFAAAEVASALSRLVRSNMMPKDEALELLENLDDWRSRDTDSADIEVSDIRLANAYVRRFELMLRVPDAMHVAVCRRMGLTLVTLDRRLGTAARALGVGVTMPHPPE